MIDIESLTLKELITERPDLVEAIKTGQDEGTTTISTKKDGDGRITEWTEEQRDIDGILVSKRVDDYIYWPSGEIQKITERWCDRNDNLIFEKIIEHFLDGRKPEVKQSKEKRVILCQK